MPDLITGAAKIALILALAILGHGVLQRTVPHFFRVTLQRRAPRMSQEDIERRQATLTRVTLWAGEGVLLLVVGLTILAEFQINIAPAVASLGVVGVALGLGAQTLIRDIISGLFVLVEDQYRVGDIVRVATVTGTVEDMNLRRTVLRDQDGVVHSVPNGEIRIASNLTRELAKVNVDLPVPYGTDLARAREVIDRTGAELAADETYGPMITEPPRMLRVDALLDSGVMLKVSGTTRPGRQWDVAGELRRRLLLAFFEAGLGLPYAPRLDVVKEEEGKKEEGRSVP